jgi:8-oxo-dGTP diphosphatase
MRESRLVAKAALLNEKGQVLILTRSMTDKIRPGELDFAGGTVEQEENYEEAVLREIMEEVGLKLSKHDVRLVFTDTSYFEGKSVIRFLYAGLLHGNPEIRLSYEHSKFAWMEIDEIEKLFTHPVWVRGLKYAVEHDLLPEHT